MQPDLDPTDAAGGAGSTVECVGCGYDLRSLPVSSNCPECGQPVARSAGRAALQLAPAAWLHRIQIGFTWQLAANLLAIADQLLLLFITPQDEDTQGAIGGPLPTLLFLAFLAVDWVAVWYVTTRDPSVIERGNPPLRQVNRLLVSVALMMSLFLLFPLRQAAGERIGIVVEFLGSSVGLASVAVWFVYTIRLVTGAGDDRLALQWSVAMIVMIVCILVTGWYPSLAWLAWLQNFQLPAVHSSIAQVVELMALGYCGYLCWCTRWVFLKLANARSSDPPPANGVEPHDTQA